MIRMIQCSSSAHAKAYFNDALSRSDYYLDGPGMDQELAGRFDGKLAERLGLSDAATKEDFYALCENTNPATGNPLTPRTKEERTTGYDINFHCPKSVSVLHALSKDDHLLEAFRESVRETMRDIEADSKTRIRVGHQFDERETGELCWGEFVHQTARPVDGSLPDPHLHAHCFVFNATWDKEENRFKAAQFRDIKRDMPYYQALFHKRLSDRLIDLGYQVKRTEKSFEVEGVPQRVIDLFSKRTNEIGQAAKEKGITDAKELDALGARTRAKKQKGHTMEELRAEWKRQILELGPDAKGGEGDKDIRFAKVAQVEGPAPKKCLDHAVSHCFERASVMQDRRLLEAAFRQSIGHRSVSLDAVSDSLNEESRIIQVKERGRTMCTTRPVLAEERRMVEMARQGKGAMVPLYQKLPLITLQGQQREAAKHVLSTTDRVSIIRGVAGSGKTTLLKELVPLMEDAGKAVTIVAPTSDASRGVLRSEGFAKADTVARLFQDKKMQEGVRGGVLLVDEAGLLGTKDMSALLALATEKDARLLLIGDTRQHSAVSRGDSLRILNTVAGIKSAEVSRIYRQKHKDYREAVEALSQGDMASAFEKLDQIEAIREIDPMRPNDRLVEDYVGAMKNGKSALVISPTHAQGEETTNAIREGLKKAGLIGKKEIEATRYAPLNLTEAEKQDLASYRPGQMVQFGQNLCEIKRGSQWRVSEIGSKGIVLEDLAGQSVLLPLDQARHFEVYREQQIRLAKGDKVRITRNGFDVHDKRLNNGQMLEVERVTKRGEITLRNAQSKATYTLTSDFGHLAHAHCVTSHASQGKTVDEVFIAQPASTFPATDQKQFYVSVSRAREKVHIYTDDKDQLLDHAGRMGDRQSAIELVHGVHPADRARDQTKERSLQVSRDTPVSLSADEKKEPVKSTVSRDYDEPRI